MGFTVYFNPATDDQVRPNIRARFQVEVATLSPLDAILVEASEPIIGSIAAGIARGDIERHPTEIGREEIGPAAIPGIVVFAFVLGFEAASKHKATGNATGATERNKQSVLIGAAVSGAREAFSGVAQAFALGH